MKKPLLFITLFYCCINLSFAQFDGIGNIDTTFNFRKSLDYATDPFNPIPGKSANFEIQAAALQTDGKIVIGGQFNEYNGQSINKIARLNSDGTLDGTFNVGTGANYRVRTLVIQPDGKIIIGGNFEVFDGVPSKRIARLNTDGSLDTSFAAGTGFNGTVNQIALQSDGKIVVVGEFTAFNGLLSKNRIIRLNTDGSFDSSFLIGTGANNHVTSLEILPNDKILVGGYFTNIYGNTARKVARLNSDGSFDSSFDVNVGPNSNVFDIAVMPNNQILVGGSFTQYKGAQRAYLAKLNDDGSLDLSFNANITDANYVTSIFPYLNGSILIGGSFTEIDGISRWSIAKLSSNGTLDLNYYPRNGLSNTVSGFIKKPDDNIIAYGYFRRSRSINGVWDGERICILKTDGSVDLNFNPFLGTNESVRKIAIQPDGDIILSGNFDVAHGRTSVGLTRILEDGTVDTTFNSKFLSYASDSALAIQNDGKILVGGGFTSYGGITKRRILRLYPNGDLDTAFQPGYGSNRAIFSIVIQPDNKILIGGEFYQYDLISRGRVARLNTDGTLDNSFDPGSGANDRIEKLLLLPNGKVIIAGWFTSFDGTSINGIARLNSDGSLDNSFSSPLNSTQLYDVEMQADGKLLIAGNFTSIGGTSVSKIARLDSNGILDTSFNPPSTNTGEFIQCIEIQDNQKILIGGTFVNYNGSSFNGIARLNTDGSLDAAFSPASGTNGSVSAITIQPNGKLLLGGDFSSYDGINRSNIVRVRNEDCSNLNSTDTINISVCDTFNWNANERVYNESGFYAATIPNSINCDSVIFLDLTVNYSDVLFDTIYVCDTFYWSANNQTYSINGDYISVLTNSSGCDSTLNLNLNFQNNIGYENQTACDSFTWQLNNETFSSSGIYIDTILNSAGCDSVVSLDLTINQSDSFYLNISSCNSYLWPTNGQTYNSSGSYFELLTNNAGCDSIVNLNLTINTSDTVFEIVNECDSFYWVNTNQTYTSSGLFSSVLLDQFGCDSIVFLDLSINSNVGFQTVASCDSFYWPASSTMYYNSGQFNSILTNSVGCDSLVTLDLTINDTQIITDSLTSCNSYFWPATNQTYNSPGIYNAQLTNQFGCDSLVTLVLDLNYSDTTSESASSCVNYTWPVNNQTYSSSGMYSAILTDQLGCDSVVTLNLTINQPSSNTIQVNSCGPYTAPDGQLYSVDGTYTAVIPNQFGCDSTITINLTIVPSPSFNAINIVSPSCLTSSDGEALLVPASGIPPYVFIWTGPSTHTGIFQSNLKSGTYLVTMIDGNGCQVTESVLIPDGAEIDGSFQISDATCGNFDGSIDLTVIGGSSPYSFQWNNGDMTEDPDSLSAGIYSVTVTDQNNCQSILGTTVNSVGGAQISLVNLDAVSCAGANDGSIDISITGDYQSLIWSNGATTEDISSLQSGPYQLIAADSISNCVSVFDTYVEEPDPITIMINKTLADCDSANATAIAQVSGGNGGYTIVWSTGIGGPSVSGLAAGNYSVTVTDSKGCSFNKPFVISENGGPQITVDSIVNGYCNTTNASIYLTTSSPNGPLTYQWSNSSGNEDLLNVNYGQYSVQIQDQNGCQSLMDFDLKPKKPQAPEICLVSVDSAINSNTILWDIAQSESYYDHFNIWRESSSQNIYQKIGSVDADDPYLFIDSISNPLVQAYRYKISVGDTCNLESSKSNPHRTIHLIQNAGLQANSVNLIWSHYAGLNFNSYEIYRNSSQNGWELINTVSAANNSYIDNPSFNISNDSSLFYAVIAQAPNSCNYTVSSSANRMWSNASSTIFNLNTNLARIPKWSSSINVFPNPSSGIFNISSEFLGQNKVGLKVYNLLGILSYSDIIHTNSYQLDMNNYESGVYFLHFLNGNESYIRKVVKE